MKINAVNNAFYSFQGHINKCEHKYLENRDNNKKISLPTAAVALLGTVLPILLVRKYQGLNLEKGAIKGKEFGEAFKTLWNSFNIDYGLKEILFVSGGSILSGLLGGFAFDKEGSKKAKIKEAVFSFDNVLIPTTITAGVMKAMKTIKSKGAITKIVPSVIGVGLGMPLASYISNKINTSLVDKNCEKRKLKFTDAFVHVDDFLAVLILAKIPLADKIQAGRFLSLIYGSLGYKVCTKK